MTTPNGGDRGRITEHREGVVASSNDRGVKLVGDDGYLNFSKYTTEPIAAPPRGSSVRLGLDGSGFVRDLQVLEGGAAAAPAGDRSPEIRRQVAMKCAVDLIGAFAQTHEEVKTEHVFPMYRRILAELEQPEI
jgi:hypothetical protein